MARQQRLPFEWQSEPDGQKSDELRIRPVGADDAPPPPADLELEADEPPPPAPAPSPEPRCRAPIVRVRHAQGDDAPVPNEVGEVGDSEETDDDDVPTSLGQVLIEARGAAGLSIAEVCDRTKVPPAFVEAAENERYKDFPAGLYARGHLAKLSAAYKIPGRRVLALYEAAVGEATAAVGAPGSDHAGGKGRMPPSAGHELDLSQYKPMLQTESAAIGWGHRLTTMVVLLALVFIVGVVLFAFGLTQYRNWRLNRDAGALGIDPNATSGLAIEEFIVEQPLPLKELPFPD